MVAIELVPGLEIWMEVVVGIVCALFAMLASAAGIGGGVIFVSMLQLFGVSPHIAAPLSKAMIFGGSFVLMCMNLFQHEDNDPTQSAIIWDLVFIIEPAAVSGALIGALINVMLPEWLLLVLEVVFLLYTAQKMLKNSMNTLNKERIAAGKKPLFVKKNKALVASNNKDTPRQQSEPIEEQSANNLSTISTDSQNHSAEEAPLLDQREVIAAPNKRIKCVGGCGVSHFKSISATRMVTFILSTALIMACQVLSQEFVRCSVGYWIVFGASFVVSSITISIITISIKRSLKIYKSFIAASENVQQFLNEANNSTFTTTDRADQTEERSSQLLVSDQCNNHVDTEALHLDAIRHAKLLIGSESFDAFNTIRFYVKFILAGLLAGMLGAMLGIGGGLLKNPVLISFGIDPERARTASTVMIAFTSMSSMISYVVIGGLNFEYAWPLMLAVGTFFVSGYYLSGLIIRCFKTKSFIPFIITALIIVCTCFIFGSMIIVFVDIANSGLLPGFTKFC